MKRLGAVLAAAGVVAVLAVSGYREATAVPRVVTYDIAVGGWPAGRAPLRIVQLSDTHVGGPDMPASRLDRIVAQVNAMKPDMVVLTGDYSGGKLFDYDTGNLDHAVRPFRRLRSRFGTFGVRGNHDEPYWAPRVIPNYRITYLENRWIDTGPVVVAGIDDRTNGAPDAARALDGVPPGKPVIMLMHEPASFPGLPARVALAFAGHTHGGQIVVPLIGSPWRPDGSGPYVRGLYAQGDRRLVVSSGVGTTAVPIRLGVPPEIVVVTLHG